MVPTTYQFQSTHSLRSATRQTRQDAAAYPVSIHALLAECDMCTAGVSRRKKRFNPRTPCGVRLVAFGVLFQIGGFNPRTPCGVRLNTTRKSNALNAFQSTHSLRSATAGPGGESLGEIVSIHALLAECDLPPSRISWISWLFQSTHSLRSATRAGEDLLDTLPVSIHALLAECDRQSPRTSRRPWRFQSTHSLRSATRFERGQVQRQSGGFNPRTPCGVRPDFWACSTPG